MNSEFNNLEFKYGIQDKFISAISENVETDLVHFWSAEKRHELTEDEIDQLYLKEPTYYSIQVDITYPKAVNIPKDRDKILSRSSIIPPYFGRNEEYFPTSKLLYISLRLDKDIFEELRKWAKNATKFFQNYLWESEGLFLRSIRFDLIPNKEKTSFTILNLPVESIEFSREPRSAIIDSQEYLKELYNEQVEFMNSPFVLWQKKRHEEMKKSEQSSNEDSDQ